MVSFYKFVRAYVMWWVFQIKRVAKPTHGMPFRQNHASGSPFAFLEWESIGAKSLKTNSLFKLSHRNCLKRDANNVFVVGWEREIPSKPQTQNSNIKVFTWLPLPFSGSLSLCCLACEKNAFFFLLLMNIQHYARLHFVRNICACVERIKCIKCAVHFCYRPQIFLALFSACWCRAVALNSFAMEIIQREKRKQCEVTHCKCMRRPRA